MSNSDWKPTIPKVFEVPTFTHSQLGQPTNIYPYYDANHKLWTYILRYTDQDGNKEIRPFTYGINKGFEGWHFKANLGPRPLYNLPSLFSNPDKIVLIPEGEKDTDAANELFPEYIATTTMFGAKSPQLTDFSPMKGRKAVVFPDNDEPGKAYALCVAKSLYEAGAQEVRMVALPEIFPAKWGLADALPENVTINDIKNLLCSAEIVARNNETKLQEPSLQNGWPFRLVDGCILYGEINDEGKEVWNKVCSELHILAHTRDHESENWGRLLCIKDIDGKMHRWPMPMELLSGEGSVYRSELLRLGLVIDPNHKAKFRLQDYITTTKTSKQLLCVNRIGWHTNASDQHSVFVLPDITFGSDEILLQGTNADRKFFITKGDLIGWQQKVAALAVGNPFICLALCTAFAPPLLEILGSESGGIHFYGNSSTGKTTAIQIAGSVWGGGGLNGFLKQWRMTCNGLEGVATNHCDSLLCLDELSQVSAKDASEASYMLANGTGKMRANKTGGLRENSQWRLIFLSNGEIPLSDKIKEDQFQKPHAGQEVRFIDLSIDTGNGMGIFENLHGFPNSEVFSRHLKSLTSIYYGTPIREFLKVLVDSRIDPNLVSSLRINMNNFIQENCPRNSDGQVMRVCNRFALIAIAGELAISYKILPWERGTAFENVSICFQRWLSNRGGLESSETRNTIKQVQHFFETNGSSRFSDIYNPDLENSHVDDNRTINRAGFRFKNKDNENEFYVFPQVFREDICKGLNSRTVSKILLDEGYIYPSTEKNRYEVKRNIPGVNKNTRIFHFNSKILSGEK